MKKVEWVTVTCEACGKTLERPPWWARQRQQGHVCDKACRDELLKQKRQTFVVSCANCGKQVEKRASEYNRTNNKGQNFYCGLKCSRQHQATLTKQVEVACPTCSSAFAVPRPRWERTKSKVFYCSHACTWQAKSVMCTCGWCGSEFRTTPGGRKKHDGATYCSKPCYDKAVTGERSPLWKQVTISCAHCGKERSVQPWQQANSKSGDMYCDNECRAKALEKRVTIACQHCGKELEVRPHRARNQKYCSHACSVEATGRGENHPRSSRIKVPCTNCQAPVERNPSYFRRHRKPFCSMSCHDAWRSKNVRGDKTPNWGGGNGVVECSQCGTQLERSRNAINSRKWHFCNHECYGKWLSENRSGKNASGWRGGRVQHYGPNWKEQRRAARARDGYRCQHCNKHQAALGYKVHVHHIRPFREFGYAPGENKAHLEANQLSNLISLCRVCHRRAEAGKIAIQPRLLHAP